MKIHFRKTNYSRDELLQIIKNDIENICADKAISFGNAYFYVYQYYLNYCEQCNNCDENVKMLCNLLDLVKMQQKYINCIKDCFLYALRQSGEIENKFREIQLKCEFENEFREIQLKCEFENEYETY
jgi:hypothetical protein